MEPRRQTLMQNGPLGNAHPSSIPVPSSVMKKPAARIVSGSSRMSMAPGAGGMAPPQSRMSVMNGGAGGGTMMARSSSRENLNGRPSVASNRDNMVGRPSMAMSRGGDAPYQSGNRGDGGIYGKTGSVRRSSIFPGRPSIAPGSALGAVPKETRPVRNLQFQQACQQNIHQYLQDSRYGYPMHSKTFTSPTQKDFQNMFNHLVQMLLPGGFPGGKSFEADCYALLKDLKYPAADSCGKTALGAPGTPQNWPHMLAMLNWLVDLCKAHHTWETELGDPMLEQATALPSDHPKLDDRILWDHSARTYLAWFDQGQEEFSAEEQELAEYYEKLAQSTFDETEELENMLARLTAELKQLQIEEPPLKKLNDDYIHLKADKAKFTHYMEQLRQKKEKTQQVIERTKAGNLEAERQIEQLKIELVELETQVAAQNLSPDEVTRMTHERETLQRQLRDMATKNAEASQKASDVEMSVTRMMDRFGNQLDEYTSFAYEIGTVASTSSAPFMGPGNVDFTIDCDVSVEDVNQIQAAGKRMRDVLRPALSKYDEEIRRLIKTLMEEQAELDEDLDKLGLAVEKQKSDAKNKALEAEKELQKADAVRAAHVKEASHLQNNINNLDSSVSEMGDPNEGFVAAQTMLETKRTDFSEMQRRTGLLQRHLIEEMGSHIAVICKAKGHAESALKGLRASVESPGP